MTAANTCDDCGKPYPGAVYYSIDPDTCSVDPLFNEPEPHEGCTANLCPACAGPYVVPDQPDDPRRRKAPNAADEAIVRGMIAFAMIPTPRLPWRR